MIVAFIGCSCVGKSTIMNLLKETRRFHFVRNIVTRYSRPGEYHKTTYTEDDFNNINKEGKLVLQNRHFNHQYAYLKDEINIGITDLTGFHMIDFGIENLRQLDDMKNTLKIILIPESEDFLLETVKTVRNERYEQIKENYQKHYSNLKEGYNSELDAFVIINKINQQGTVAYNILNYLVGKRHVYISSAPLFKNERLKLIIENIKSYPASSNGLEAYKVLTECIDKFEDNIWGDDNYNPPRSFLRVNSTDRLYTIFPESFFSVPEFSGVTLLLSREEIIFISRYGAIEAQSKIKDDTQGNRIHFSKRKENVFLVKHDKYGDGVWVEKNR